MGKKIDAPKAWTDRLSSSGKLCYWAEPTRGEVERLPGRGKGRRAVRVRIIRETDYQMLLRKAGMK